MFRESEKKHEFIEDMIPNLLSTKKEYFVYYFFLNILIEPAPA